MRLVISGFEPFAGRELNQSQELAKALARKLRAPRRTLPVRFGSLGEAVLAVASERPQAWLMLGESGRAQGLVLERVAYNRIDARIPDNDGAQPEGARVAHGPPRRFASPDVDALLEQLQARGVPAVGSDDPGRYACNAAYYRALLALPGAPILFVHVPAEPEAAPRKKLLEGLALVAEALRSASPRAPTPARSSARRRSARSSPRARR